MITTITTTAAEDARIAVAFGHYRMLGRPATAAEVKAILIDFVATIVQKDEAQIAAAAAQAAITPPAPIAPA